MTARRLAVVALAAILILDVALRAHTLGTSVGAGPEPLDCDEAIYVYIGQHLRRGEALYRDVTDTKPPGGYWLFAAISGDGGGAAEPAAIERAVRLLPVPMVLATIALIWWLGLRLGGPAAAVAGALVYAIASTDPYLFGNGSNLEHPINLLATAALAWMVFAWGRPGRMPLVGVGACLGAAFLFKQVAALHGPVFSAALLCRSSVAGQRRRIGSRIVDATSLALGFLAVAALAGLILGAQGAGVSAYEEVFRYGAALARETPADPKAPPFLLRWFVGNSDPRNGALPWPFGATDYLVWWGTGTWPFWALGLPSAAWLGLKPGSDGPRRLSAAWVASAWVQVALPGLFWQHYYLLPLPGIAVAVGVVAGDAWGALGVRPYWRRILPAVVLVAVVGAVLETARIQRHDYLGVSPEQIAAKYKGGGQWVVLRTMGGDLRRRTAGWGGAGLYVWGWQSPLYVYSGLGGASRHVFVDPLMKAFAGRGHPLIGPRLERVMADLRAHPPDLIFAGDPPFPALRRFLDAHYLRSAIATQTPDGRGLWVARGRYRDFESAAPGR